MSDKMLDSTQLISGAAVLLSFFVGYKYGLKINSKDNVEKSTSKIADGDSGGRVNKTLTFSFFLNIV